MIKRILRNVIPLLICVLGVLVFIEARSPFKTKEQKQVKEMYQYSFQNIDAFKLKSVDTDSKNGVIYFRLLLKTRKTDNSFDKDELLSMNLSVERMIQYLNEKDNFNKKYDNIQLYFYPGNGNLPEFIAFSIKDDNQKYVFDNVYSKYCNGLFDLYVMKDVCSISIYGSPSKYYSLDKLEEFSELKNLKEIGYTHDTDIEDLKTLKKALQAVLPECKLYVGDVEVILED